MNRYRLLWLLPLGLLFLLASSALAEVGQSLIVDQVRADFSVAEGYILMPLDGEYLVDLGAQSGARVGDLLSATRTGERIVHPVSGEDLGMVEVRSALLEVTSVQSKYSHARVISGTLDLARGTVVKRFAAMKAVFNGEGKNAEALYNELRNALPSLNWQSAGRSGDEPVDLRFVLNKGHLEVRTSDRMLLRRYVAKGLSIENAIDPGAALITPSPVGVAASTGGRAGAPALVEYSAEETRGSVVATLAGEVLMADFVQGADELLLAATDGSGVRVYRVAKQLELLAERSFDDRRVHSLSWWQPDTGGLFLAVSGSAEGAPGMGAATKTEPLSGLFRMAEGRLEPAYQDLAYFLGTADSDGNGSREKLLGQPLDLDNAYGRVVLFRAESGRLRSASPDFTLPYPFPVQGGAISRLSGRKQPETIRLKGGVLSIFRGKKRIFQSRKGLGGSISQLRYDRNPEQEATLFGTLVFEVNPVAVDIDGDGLKELVAVSSKRPGLLESFGNRSSMAEAGLAVLKYREGDYVRGNLNVESDAPIQGLYADADRILFVASGFEGPGGTEKVSRLVQVSLADTH